jgi:transcriptional regulator with XRE-family HTH domain
MNTNEKKVYERVREYIESRHMKQNSIAKAAGIHASTFNAMLHGKRTMYADDLMAICTVLNESADTFIRGKISA